MRKAYYVFDEGIELASALLRRVEEIFFHTLKQRVY